MNEVSSKGRVGRLIQDGARNGAFNMAADLYFSELAAETSSLILRFYAWDKPTLSIGYHQKLSDRQIERCLSYGVPIVRRPTGGRAVLHDRELTYCLGLSEKHPVFNRERASILKSIGSAFVNAAAALGLNAQLIGAGNRGGATSNLLRRGSPLCFDSASRWEVRLNGQKWIGSAQRFLPGVMLQHGSILLQRNEFDLTSLLVLPENPDADSDKVFAHDRINIHGKELRWAIVGELSRCWDLSWSGKPIQVDEVNAINHKAENIEYYRNSKELPSSRSVSIHVA